MLRGQSRAKNDTQQCASKNACQYDQADNYGTHAQAGDLDTQNGCSRVPNDLSPAAGDENESAWPLPPHRCNPYHPPVRWLPPSARYPNVPHRGMVWVAPMWRKGPSGFVFLAGRWG